MRQSSDVHSKSSVGRRGGGRGREDGPAGRLPNRRTAQGTRQDHVQNSMGVTGTGKEASWGPLGSAVRFGVPRQPDCMQLLAGTACEPGGWQGCPCQTALPLSAHFCVAPHARQGNHEPHLIPSCPIMALAGHPPAPLFLIPAHSPSSAPSSRSSIPSAFIRSSAHSSPVASHGDLLRPAAGQRADLLANFADYLLPPNIQPACRIHVNNPPLSG